MVPVGCRVVRCSRYVFLTLASVVTLGCNSVTAGADEPGFGGRAGSLKDEARVQQVRSVLVARRVALRQLQRSPAPDGVRRVDWLYDHMDRVGDGRLWNAIVGEPLPEQGLRWRGRTLRRAALSADAVVPKRAASTVRLALNGPPLNAAVGRSLALPRAPDLKPTVPSVTAGPVAPVLPVSPQPTLVTPRVAPRIVVPEALPTQRDIATGTLQTPQMPGDRPFDDDDVLELAAKSQAALDLVKLELAARTYDEQKQPGERVFVERPDWKLLEDGLDSMSDSERSVAITAGFIAHTYVNDATQTIVVAVAGSQDLRRDFIAADVWDALIRSAAPQHFYFAKSYVKSVVQRYQLRGYVTECVGHSLGGGACAYAAAELGVRAYVVNPIAVGKLATPARSLVTNYIVDGDIASIVYPAFGNEFGGDIRRISNGREKARAALRERFGVLAGPILVVRDAASSVTDHKISRALERIAVHAGVTRPR